MPPAMVCWTLERHKNLKGHGVSSCGMVEFNRSSTCVVRMSLCGPGIDGIVHFRLLQRLHDS